MKTYGITISRFLLLLLFLFWGRETQAGTLRGTLSAADPQNYLVLAISKGGTANIAPVDTAGKFSVKAKKNSTLHILLASGTYVGPLVLPQGSKAFAKVSGKGGNVGRATLKTGFATLKFKKANSLYVLSANIPFSKNSGPRGAGKLGLVAVSSRTLAAGNVGVRAGVGADSDRDGLPDLLDLDDDGDLILDALDADDDTQSELEPAFTSALRLSFRNSLNVNASGVTESDIDAAIQSDLSVTFAVRNNAAASKSITKVNVDCGSLPYCISTSGTATISGPAAIDAALIGQLWTAYDTDLDTLPNLFPDSAGTTLPFSIVVDPNVTRASLKPGDTVLYKAVTSDGDRVIPGLLPFYFATSPAVYGYSDGTASATISYPPANNADGTSFNRAISLNSSSLTLSFWRPQRPAISGAEPGSFVDMGRLQYGVILTFQSTVTDSEVRCTPEDYSAASSTLSQIATAAEQTDAIFLDRTDDAAPDSANVLSFMLNLQSCIARAGLSTSGTRVKVDLIAASRAGDQASQEISFRLP